MLHYDTIENIPFDAIKEVLIGLVNSANLNFKCMDISPYKCKVSFYGKLDIIKLHQVVTRLFFLDESGAEPLGGDYRFYEDKDVPKLSYTEFTLPNNIDYTTWRTVIVPKDTIMMICKYCEDQAIYDKLSKYGDFYYKLKGLIK